MLLDVKRGDIGSTSAGVRRRLPRPGLARWPPTRSPSARTSASARCDPFVDTARKHDAGVFVLALTSNKEAPEVQHAPRRRRAHRRRHGARPPRARLNAGAEPLGSFGAVVGATRRRRPARTSPSTARCSRPASAPRAAPPPTSGGSSARPCRPCCPAPRASCSARPGRGARCATPPAAPTTSCAALSRDGRAPADGRTVGWRDRRSACGVGSTSPNQRSLDRRRLTGTLATAESPTLPLRCPAGLSSEARTRHEPLARLLSGVRGPD